MMRAFRCCAALILASAAAMAACGPPPAAVATDAGTGTALGNFIRTESGPPALIEMPLGVTVDAVWRVLPGVFASLELPVGIMDARNRVIGQNRIVVQNIDGRAIRNFFRCAYGGAGPSGASSYRIQFDLAAQPRDSSKRAELVMRTNASATSTDPSRSGTVGCTSNGELEKLIQSRIEMALRGG